MNKAIAENGGPNGADTRLHLDLKGRHPDEGSSDIAYEKGAEFLRTMEAIVGRDRFDAWLKGWFDRHAFQPVTSAMFLADIRQNLVKGDKALENKLMLDRWVYQPGVPPNMVRPPAGTFAEQDRRRRICHRAAAAAAGTSGIPRNGCASSTACRASFEGAVSTRSSRRSGSTRATQHGSPLRLARSGGRQPLRPGGPLAGAIPDLAGPRQVREAADQGAREGPAGAGRSPGASTPRRGRSITRW